MSFDADSFMEEQGPFTAPQKKEKGKAQKVVAAVATAVKTVATKVKKSLGPIDRAIALIELRFMESAGISVDLSVYPIKQDQQGVHQAATNKAKSDEHGEVFTPMWLVDHMIEKAADFPWKNQNKTTEDLCSGYGQFTVRLLRKKYSVLGEKFDLKKFLTETHLFIEIQPDSCYRLLYTFGKKIRLLIGDAAQKGKLPDTAETGIWVWSDVCERWYDCTVQVQQMFDSVGTAGTLAERAAAFMKRFNAHKKRIESRRRGA